jgi:hypothetical protein
MRASQQDLYVAEKLREADSTRIHVKAFLADPRHSWIGVVIRSVRVIRRDERELLRPISRAGANDQERARAATEGPINAFVQATGQEGTPMVRRGRT